MMNKMINTTKKTLRKKKLRKFFFSSLFFSYRTDETNELSTTVQNFLTIDDNQRSNGMKLYQKTVKSLNESRKSPSDGNSCISKPSTSSKSVHDTQQSNDFPLSINRISNDMIMENEKTSRFKLDPKKLMNISSNINHKLPNIKLTISNSLSNDTDRISSQHDNNISTRMTQSAIETNVFPNVKNEFKKLQLTRNFDCYDYDESISCKKIELKKYIEFDTSSFWNKK